MSPRSSALVAVAALSLAPALANARDEPATKAAAAPPASAPSRPPPPVDENAPLPPGHPRTAAPSGDDDEDGPAPQGQGPIPGMFQPPPDTSEEDPSLPAGTLLVEVRDADNQPVPNAKLVLVTLHQSVAKGQDKQTRSVEADASGRLRLDHLEVGSAVSYWVKDLVGPATFASSPAQLTPLRGVHQVMHVYPVARDLATALIVIQGAIYFEVKDDRVQVEEALTFFNFGKTAWVPDNFVIRLPKDFTALTSQAQMSDQGIDPMEKVGAKLRGTYPPGRHDLDFRWQLPYDGEKELSLDVALPAHVAIMRVMAAGGHQTTLDVAGFPEAQRRTDRQGQKILVTEKQVKRDAPLASVHVLIRGLLTPGPGRYIASSLAALAILAGLFLGVKPKTRSKAGAKSERAELLAEVAELERARQRGDVGPRTYERARRALVDAIAETLEPTA